MFLNHYEAYQAVAGAAAGQGLELEELGESSGADGDVPSPEAVSPGESTDVDAQPATKRMRRACPANESLVLINGEQRRYSVYDHLGVEVGCIAPQLNPAAQDRAPGSGPSLHPGLQPQAPRIDGFPPPGSLGQRVDPTDRILAGTRLDILLAQSGDILRPTSRPQHMPHLLQEEEDWLHLLLSLGMDFQVWLFATLSEATAAYSVHLAQEIATSLRPPESILVDILRTVRPAEIRPAQCIYDNGAWWQLAWFVQHLALEVPFPALIDAEGPRYEAIEAEVALDRAQL